MTKQILLLLTALSLFSILRAQTVVNTPIINDYAAVSAIDFCTNSMQVTDNDELNFNIGDYVLIVQMKGAIAGIQANDADFGQVRNYVSAGLYEYNFVKGVNLGSVNGIQFENELSHPYNVLAKVQIIKVPRYNDVIIQNTLSSLPWDGSKGGILVFEASGNISLEANIVLDENGFRGGGFSNDNGCYTNSGGFLGYSCASADNCGGFVGEGLGPAYEAQLKGKGRDTNAGGGGNDHNAGGGGGANGGNGGNGGSNDLNTQFCNGEGGLGGAQNNPSSTENRILMAGGGGAGDSNNDTGTPGGKAGATVIIKGESLQSNGFIISSNGQSAASSAADGPGGGGAGGTIILDINQYNDNLAIEAKGGDGGDNTDSGNCPGVGGGGSGGLVWYSQSSVPANVIQDLSGGNQGVYTSTLCSGLQLGVQDGEDGRALFNYNPFVSTETFLATTVAAQKDTTICLGDSALLSAQVQSSFETDLEWLLAFERRSIENTWFAKPNERGLFSYTARAFWTVFDQSCEETASVTVNLRNPDITIIASPNTPVDTGGPVFLNGVINPPSTLYTYTWDPSFVNPNDSRNVVATPFQTTSYCLSVTDEIGCVTSACKEVLVNIPPSGSPTAFSPNNDGINDVFRILPLPQLRLKSLQVYSRWGDLLYTSNTQFTWDGTFKGEAQQPDSYVWVAEFEHKNTKERATQSGTFLLIR